MSSEMVVGNGGAGDFSKVWKGEGLSKALQAMDVMNQEGKPIPKSIIRSILQGCMKRKDLVAGRQLHSLMADNGLNSIDFLAEELIRLFALCGSLSEANQAFYNVSNPSVYTWNAIISANSTLGSGGKALELYYRMCQTNKKPDKVTLLHIMKACSRTGAIMDGRLIHKQIIRSEIQYDVIVGSAIIDMYAKCGCLEDAVRVFDELPRRDVVSWGAMISGCTMHGHGRLALKLAAKMQEEGRRPNEIIYSCVLKACGNIGAIVEGRLIHEQIISSTLNLDTVLGNTIVDMYVNCGSVDEARKVFDNLSVRDVVSWGVMISGYAQHGYGLSALALFEKLQHQDVKPDKVMLLCLLKACSNIGAILHGRLVHEQVIKNALDSDVVIRSSVVDMYVKCGNLVEAHKVFDKQRKQDKVSWATIVIGFAQQGNWNLAAQCLKDMQRHGSQPDGVIFTGILNACSHAGLLEEGLQYFKTMIDDHSIIPTIEHYNCLVDLLSRAGRLQEAEDLLETMPIAWNIILWTSLLTSCKTYGNAELGRRCFDNVIQLDPNDASNYTLMSSLYAVNHMWEDVDRMQELKKEAGAQRKPGRAWIEANKEAQEFIVGCTSNAQSHELYAKLKRFNTIMKKLGHVAQLDLVFEVTPDENTEIGS